MSATKMPEPITQKVLHGKIDELARLIRELPAQRRTDILNRSLIEGLAGEDPKDQIFLTISNDEYFQK